MSERKIALRVSGSFRADYEFTTYIDEAEWARLQASPGGDDEDNAELLGIVEDMAHDHVVEADDLEINSATVTFPDGRKERVP